MTHTSLKIWTLQIFSGPWIGHPHSPPRGPTPSHLTRCRPKWNSNWHLNPSETGTPATTHSWRCNSKRAKKSKPSKGRDSHKCRSKGPISIIMIELDKTRQVLREWTPAACSMTAKNSKTNKISLFSTLIDNGCHRQPSRNFWSKIYCNTTVNSNSGAYWARTPSWMHQLWGK